MPSKTCALGTKAITLALKYSPRKYPNNVSRGIIEMGRCIGVLEKANKEKTIVINGSDLTVAVAYICKNKPELLKEVVCKQCAEDRNALQKKIDEQAEELEKYSRFVREIV